MADTAPFSSVTGWQSPTYTPSPRVIGRPVLTALFISAGLVDIPRAIELGNTTASAGWTLLAFVLGWAAWVRVPQISRSVLIRILPFLLFFAWVIVTALSRGMPLTKAGSQNITVLLAFLGLLLLAARTTVVVPRLYWSISRAAMVSGLLACLIYAAQLVLAGWGATWPMGARAFGLFALVPLAWSVGQSPRMTARQLFAVGAVVFLIVASLSRTAVVVALLITLIGRFAGSRGSAAFGRNLLTLLAFSILVPALMHVSAFTARFSGGDNAQTALGIHVNTSGRQALWTYTWHSYLQSPWAGHGPGAAEDIVSAHFPGLSHPHNGYLQVLHDYGAVGFVLLIGFFISIGQQFVAVLTREQHPGRRGAACVGLLVAFGLLATMSTDNGFVYPAVMIPTGISLGTCLGITSKKFEWLAQAET